MHFIKNWPTDRLVAGMQFLLTVVYTIAFFVVVFLVIAGTYLIPESHLRLVDQLFGALIAVLIQQSSYWFSRQRGQSPEPPPAGDPPA